MKVYLKTVNLFRKIHYPVKYREYYKLSMLNFSDLINSYEYKADPLNGLFDYVAEPDEFFNKDRKEGRDCDDFQRQWSLWGVYNDYVAKEYIICNPSSIKKAFSTMHVIGTLYRDKRYYLSNYTIHGPWKTEEEALDYMKHYPSYKDDRLIVFSREIPKEKGAF